MFDSDQHWVQAAPFRALVTRLIDITGLPWPDLARHASVPPAVIHRLIFGRGGRSSGRIPHECARRLLALDETMLVALARLPRH
nr:hypothetical protein [Propionicimonas sp.]